MVGWRFDGADFCLIARGRRSPATSTAADGRVPGRHLASECSKQANRHRRRPQSSSKRLKMRFRGRLSIDFGTVRPRVQIPGPRPFLYSKSPISEAVMSRQNTPGSQIPRVATLPRAVVVNIISRFEIARQQSVAVQSFNPEDAQGWTVSLTLGVVDRSRLSSTVCRTHSPRPGAHRRPPRARPSLPCVRACAP